MRAAKFGAVGVANTLLDFIIFYTLTRTTGLAAPLANLVSYSCGIGLSFGLNRAWTFGDRRRAGAGAQLVAFVVGNLVGLAISTAVVTLLVGQYGPVTAKLISVAASFVWNFAFANFIAFRR